MINIYVVIQEPSDNLLQLNFYNFICLSNLRLIDLLWHCNSIRDLNRTKYLLILFDICIYLRTNQVQDWYRNWYRNWYRPGKSLMPTQRKKCSCGLFKAHAIETKCFSSVNWLRFGPSWCSERCHYLSSNWFVREPTLLEFSFSPKWFIRN